MQKCNLLLAALLAVTFFGCANDVEIPVSTASETYMILETLEAQHLFSRWMLCLCLQQQNL